MTAPGPVLRSLVDPFHPHPYRVVARRRETSDTVTLRLCPATDPYLPGSPGQFMMLTAFGIGEVPISLSRVPDRSGMLEHTIRAVGSVTRHLVALRPGDWVGVRGPFGTGWPLDLARGRDVLLVAGGLGFAPLRSALEAILERRQDYRRVTVLLGARTPSDVLYRQILPRWQRRNDLDLRVTVDRPDERWRGQVGVVPQLVSQVAPSFEPTETVAFICGPDVMMRFTVRELQRHGVSDDRIFLSLERNMQCGVGLCGHCQLGPFFLCKDGPVLPYSRLMPFYEVREL